MTAALISVTAKGRELSRKISALLSEKNIVKRFCFYKNSDENAVSFSDIKSLTASVFYESDALIFICACGIAVRSVAPLIKSKASDPAVIVIDDEGRFVIPVLSGHIGGANRLAGMLALRTGAQAAITTATDIGGRFSPDSFAKANGLIISDFLAAKEIAAAVLNDEKTGLVSDFVCENIPEEICTGKLCRTGICISDDVNRKPFETTLNLVPKNIILGIGCKRGIPCEVIEKHVLKSMQKSHIDTARLCAVITIDIKSDEKGILDFCEKYGLDFFTYSAKELMSVSGDFNTSDFVLKQTGTDNVCERSVVRHGGRLIMPKTSADGVTAAAAELTLTIDFEKEFL